MKGQSGRTGISCEDHNLTVFERNNLGIISNISNMYMFNVS